MNTTKVVAISGASGCGKTALVKQLADTFNCPYLHFDDYVDENSYPNDMHKWLNDGASLSAIKTPNLVIELQKLLAHKKCKFIFIEEPFGRERETMRLLIDYVILLDHPLEICLARVVNRSINNPMADSLTLLPKYLANYQSYYRNCYLEAVNQVRNNSDYIISDLVSVEATANLVINWLT